MYDLLGDIDPSIILEQHYTKSMPSGKSLVYRFEDAVVVISIPANNNVSAWLGCPENRVWELTRLWAPDQHRPSLLTEAIASAVRQFHQRCLADALISYADPNAGHKGGIYRAASWTFLGQSDEGRAYRALDGQIVSRRKFHSGRNGMTKAEILATGYREVRLPGKFRFARGLTRLGKRAVRLKAATNPIAGE